MRLPGVTSIVLVTLSMAAAGHVGIAAQGPAVQAPGETPETLMLEGRRLFDAFDYEQAVPVFDRVIALSAPSAATRADLLVLAYELRARSKFALEDTAGTEADFAALLALRPNFALGSAVSPRVVSIFDTVKRRTVGQLMLTLTPVSDVSIDGRPYTVEQIVQALDLPAGDHLLAVAKPGYTPVSQHFTITAGERTPLTVVSERTSATVSLTTIPEGVEVAVDGAPRGVTKAGDGLSEGSAPLVLSDLLPGSHRLRLRRDCYTTHERQINIEQPDDFVLDLIRLAPAVATANVETSDTDTTIYVDGKPRGPAPGEVSGICEGNHTVEVRSPRGRFMDRREWHPGDAITLKAVLKPAFAVVTGGGAASSAPTPQFLTTIERALNRAESAMFYAPTAADIGMALQEENAPVGWLKMEPAGGGAPSGPPMSKDTRRDLGSRLATRLDVQGFVSASLGADQDLVTLTFLASGSGEPEVLTYRLSDEAALTRVLATISAPVPRLLKPSIEVSVVDLGGTEGAAIVRSGGAGARAGLAPGDVIVAAGGAPIASVAQLRTKVSTLEANATLPIEATAASGASKRASVTVSLVPDAVPLKDSSLLYNRLLLDAQRAIRAEGSDAEQSVARLNLAIVNVRLGNFEEAFRQLQDVKLPDGPGVSSGTVAYLSGLCSEALGRSGEATEAFKRAAAIPLARLSDEGLLIAPLAQQKLRLARP